MKAHGRVRRSMNEDWRKIVCFISYQNAKGHAKIVEDSFRYCLRLDVEDIKQHQSDHFEQPHNVTRAILLHYYCRNRHLFFEEDHWEYLAYNALPARKPDEEGENYSVWVDETNK